MKRGALMRASVLALMITAAGCQPKTPAQSSPSEPADLTGQVTDVRIVSGLPGLSVSVGGGSSGGSIRRLRIRVIGSQHSAPGTDAYIGLDGVTRVTRTDARAGVDAREDLTGAFVRIWFRGLPRTWNPTETAAMARIVAIDSIAPPEPNR